MYWLHIESFSDVMLSKNKSGVCFLQVGVYRMSDERIGCSLADAAATTEYMKYLEIGSLSPPSLHVIYINTSLETKAHAHELVPTITCTSSNVVQTILQVSLMFIT